MTRQTRIGLLVGLAFIILFGLVLGELTETSPPAPAPGAMEDVGSYAHARPVEEIYVPEGEEISIDVPWARDEALADALPDARDVGDMVLAAGRPEAAPARGVSRPIETARPERIETADPSAEGGPAAATVPAPRTHTVRPNDSLIRIARAWYGDRRWRQYKRIYQANRHKLPDESTLQVGMVLVIPPLEDEAASAADRTRAVAARPPAATPGLPGREMTIAELGRYFGVSQSRRASAGRVYVVRRGDNLTRIARITLHDDSRAAVLKIYNANRDKLSSPDRLPVGLALRIPANG